MCKTRILSTKDQTVISSCVGCGMYYIWHNNILMNFTTEAFHTFRDLVIELRFNNNNLPFPDGEDRVILHTPNADVCFAFDYEEFESFKTAIEESLYMNEVYSLVFR